MRHALPLVLVTFTFTFSGAGPALAQEFSAACRPIYEEIIADHPMNLETCVADLSDYELDTCTPPAMFNRIQSTSHLILAIDASGSMAGQIGGQTKMAIAQAEAIAFLADIPPEVSVGLVVYGHRGTNDESGRAESCAASELIHDFDTNRASLAGTINGLTPTGWTPLGGTLEFAQTLVDGLPPSADDNPLSPVVYLISDGEETCDGDPVAAATALFEAGVQTTVNTIGFAVDAETQAQLAGIAQAGGGIYYPAEDAAALRAQLNVIKEAEAAATWYQYCVDGNAGAIAMVYHNARVSLAGCYARNNPQVRRNALFNAVNRARGTEGPVADCLEELNTHALYGFDAYNGWLPVRMEGLTDVPLRLIEEYRGAASLEALQAAQ